MADRASAREALYTAIEKELGDLGKIGSTFGRGRAIAQLALAFRYVDGGQQPGVSAPEAKE